MARRWSILLLLALGFLVGCQGRLNTIAPTATSTGEQTAQALVPATETPTRIPPTKTATPSPTDTITPSVTPTDTPSVTPSPSDTPLPTDTPSPSPSPSPDFTKTALFVYLMTLAASTPTPDVTLTAQAQAVQQTEIAGYLADTLTAQPTLTPLPSDTPTVTGTPRPSDTPITIISSTPNLTETAQANTQVAAAVAGTLAALPTDTPIPSFTPSPTVPLATTTPRPSGTPISIISSTPNLAATDQYESLVEAAVIGTLADMDTSTPYPTFTPEPTNTAAPIVTPSPDAAATERAAAAISEYVAGTLTAQPTATEAAPTTPTIHAQETRIAGYVYGTLTALPSLTPLPTRTIIPTDTPFPPTLATLYPTPSVTPSPPFDLPATATAIVAAATATAEARPEISSNQRTATAIIAAASATPRAQCAPPTYTQNQLLATEIVAGATMTANAPTATVYTFVEPTIVPTSPYSTAELTQTAVATSITATAYAESLPTQLPPEDLTATATSYRTAIPSATLPPISTLIPTPSATFTPTMGFGGTATSIVATATAAAQLPPLDHFESLSFGVAFDVPEGWRQPLRSGDHQLYLGDDTAQIFIYRGDSVYFADEWGIPAAETDLDAAARTIADNLGGVVGSTEIAGTALVTIEGDPSLGGMYLRALPDGAWIIISVSAPADDFAGYQNEVFDPLVEGMKVSRWVGPPTITPTFTNTATAVPVTPTAGPSPTPGPVVFEPYTSEYLGLSYDVPAGWITWQDNTYSDPELGMRMEFIYADERDIGYTLENLNGAAVVILRLDLSVQEGMEEEDVSPKELLLMMGILSETEITPYTIAGQQGARGVNLRDDLLLVAYAVEMQSSDWLVMFLAVPPGEPVLLLDETIMQPVVNSVQVSEESNVTPTPHPTYEPPEVTFEPYSNDDLDLTFDRPSGWFERQDKSSYGRGTGFYINSDDVNNMRSDQPVTAPAISLQRVGRDELGNFSYDSPFDFFDTFLGVASLYIQPYLDAAYPAARALVDSEFSMVYALQVSDTDWIVASFAVPPGADLLALDEMIMQPVVNSIRVLDGVEITATPTALPTYTPTATFTPTPA